MFTAQTGPPDHLAAIAALSPDDRALLQTFLEEPSLTLLALARKLNTNLAGLAARILSDSFQAALAAICSAADSLARLRAAVGGPAALDTLATSCLSERASVTQQRLAATAILRFTDRRIRPRVASAFQPMSSLSTPSSRASASREPRAQARAAPPTRSHVPNEPSARAEGLREPRPEPTRLAATVPSRPANGHPLGPELAFSSFRPIGPISPIATSRNPGRSPSAILSVAGRPSPASTSGITFRSRDRPALAR